MPSFICPECGSTTVTPLGQPSVICGVCDHVFAPDQVTPDTIPFTTRWRLPFLVGACVVIMLVVAFCGLVIGKREQNQADQPLAKNAKQEKPLGDPKETEKFKVVMGRAGNAVKNQQWADTILYVDEALDLYPKHPDALFLRGTARISLAMLRNPIDMHNWARGIDDLRVAGKHKESYQELYEDNVRYYKKMAILLGID